MVAVNYRGISKRVACHQCIIGHRARKCDHLRRNLIEVRKPGRPLQSCPHPPDSIQCNCHEEKFFFIQGHDPITNDEGEIINIEKSETTAEYPKSTKSSQKGSYNLKVPSPPSVGEYKACCHDGSPTNQKPSPIDNSSLQRDATDNSLAPSLWNHSGSEAQIDPNSNSDNKQNAGFKIGGDEQLETERYQLRESRGIENFRTTVHGCCAASKRQANENSEKLAERKFGSSCCSSLPKSDQRKRDNEGKIKSSCCSSTSSSSSTFSSPRKDSETSIDQSQGPRVAYRPIVPAPATLVGLPNKSDVDGDIQYFPVALGSQIDLSMDNQGSTEDCHGHEHRQQQDLSKTVIFAPLGLRDDCICESHECLCIDCAKHPYNAAQRAHVAHLIHLQTTEEYIAEEERLNQGIEISEIDFQQPQIWSGSIDPWHDHNSPSLGLDPIARDDIKSERSSSSLDSSPSPSTTQSSTLHSPSHEASSSSMDPFVPAANTEHPYMSFDPIPRCGGVTVIDEQVPYGTRYIEYIEGLLIQDVQGQWAQVFNGALQPISQSNGKETKVVFWTRPTGYYPIFTGVLQFEEHATPLHQNAVKQHVFSTGLVTDIENSLVDGRGNTSLVDTSQPQNLHPDLSGPTHYAMHLPQQENSTANDSILCANVYFPSQSRESPTPMHRSSSTVTYQDWPTRMLVGARGFDRSLLHAFQRRWDAGSNGGSLEHCNMSTTNHDQLVSNRRRNTLHHELITTYLQASQPPAKPYSTLYQNSSRPQLGKPQDLLEKAYRFPHTAAANHIQNDATNHPFSNSFAPSQTLLQESTWDDLANARHKEEPDMSF